MSLIITFMLEPAKLQMNCANASGSSARRSAARGRPAPSETVIALSSTHPPQAERAVGSPVTDVPVPPMLPAPPIAQQGRDHGTGLPVEGAGHHVVDAAETVATRCLPLFAGEAELR